MSKEKIIKTALAFLDLFVRNFSGKGSLSKNNLKSGSTLSTSVISITGVVYSIPPQNMGDWVFLLASVVLGFLGFWYRERH